MTIAARLLAEPLTLLSHQRVSLMHGWVPLTVQVLAAATLLAAVGWRSRRWRFVMLPLAVIVGLGLTVGAFWYVSSEGLAGDPAPKLLWIWTASTGAAVVVLVAGWRTAPRWRRAVSTLAPALCLVCAALTLNLWVGYFPTVQTAWNQLTAGPLPDQTDQASVVAMQKARRIPSKGSVVPVNIDSAASGFKHRGELVYLPPAWFASNPPAALPTIMMIGGEFNTPADWLRAGNAVNTIDGFAARHAGNAPVLVFVDSGGAFNNDTECVNGSRGNAADHLTNDVVPFMEATYGVSTNRANWGIVGWSMGGTCALDLTVMHPDTFSAFEDIAGDLSPNSGTKKQTIDRLFGGSAARYADFDPITVINRHGRFSGISGWFAVNGSRPSASTEMKVVDVGGGDLGGQHTTVNTQANTKANTSAQMKAAHAQCASAGANGIDCAVVEQPGKHDWPFAAQAFAAALPWLAGTLGTPGVPSRPLPAPSEAAVMIQGR